MNPTCPPNYSCQFTVVHPRVITHYSHAAWWQHDGGLAITIVLGMVALCLVGFMVYFLCYTITGVSSSKSELHKRELEEGAKERERRYKLAIEEQRTLQIDGAKGNPEMLEIVKEMNK